MVAVQAIEENGPLILITEPIAQEGIDLLRYELPILRHRPGGFQPSPDHR